MKGSHNVILLFGQKIKEQKKKKEKRRRKRRRKYQINKSGMC
jgi:hypothetical protein